MILLKILKIENFSLTGIFSMNKYHIGDFLLQNKEKWKDVLRGELDKDFGYEYSKDGAEIVNFHVDDSVSFQ